MAPPLSRLGRAHPGIGRDAARRVQHAEVAQEGRAGREADVDEDARNFQRRPRAGCDVADEHAANRLLAQDPASRAPSLGDYVQQMGWMNPIYAKLRQAIASRLYRNPAELRLLSLNLERARALPSGSGRYVIVNPPAARLYMCENGQVVDSMRVVAGRPDPIAQTPMMNAFIQMSSSAGQSLTGMPSTSLSTACSDQASVTSCTPFPDLKMMSTKRSSWNALPIQ